MFTLRIIFFGLIALVDDGRKQGEGALALLVQAPRHEASVFMLEGECKSDDVHDCFRFPGSQEESDLLARAFQKAQFHLTWFLDREHLTIPNLVGKEDWDQPVRVVFGDTIPSFPTSESESRDLIWVPELAKIDENAGDLRSDCLNVPNGCPVAARFGVDRGEVSSCHLVHEGNGAAAEVHAFDFRPASATAATDDTPRAIADAVMVELKVNSTDVTLTSQPFGSSTAQTLVKLAPQNGRITLIVSNNDYSGFGSHSHFSHYYELTQNGTAAGLIPHPRSKQRLDTGPGSCEAILDNLEKALGVGNIDGLHNHRECDMTKIRTSPPPPPTP